MMQILKRLFIDASNTDFQRLKLENMKRILILVSMIIKLTLTFISSTIILMLKRYKNMVQKIIFQEHTYKKQQL